MRTRFCLICQGADESRPGLAGPLRGIRPSRRSAAAGAAGRARGGGSVEGLVTTADGRAVVGARVGLVGMAEPTSTSDVDGRFRLSNLPRRPATGCARSSRASAGGSGPSKCARERRPALRLTLPFLPFSETVTVTATRSERKLGDSPADLTVLTREDLQRWPAPAMDDALKQVPSFSLFRRTSSLVSHPTTQGVSLRGVGASGASRTLVLVDGVPHNDAFGNWVYWDSIPQLQVESIEVAPSGLSHLYGSSAMAGVINVVDPAPGGQDGVRPRLRGKPRHRGCGAVRKPRLRSPGRRPWAGASSGPTATTLVREDQRGPVDVEAASRHRTGNWRVEYSPSPGFTLFQNGRVFAEDRENGTPLQTNSTRETYLGGGLRATTAESGAWQANVFAHLDDFDSTFSAVAADRASETLSLVQAVDYKDVGGNLQWSRRARRVPRAGRRRRRALDRGRQQRGRVHRPGRQRSRPADPGPSRSTPAPTSRTWSRRGGGRSSRWALRVDHWRNYDASQTEIVNSTGATTVTPYSDTSKTRVTPRGGVLVHLGDRFAVRGAVYGGFRAPSLNELYRPFRVGNVVTQGNPDLGPERLLGGELGLNHASSSKLSWRATAFWDRVDDPIANVTVSATPALITRQRQNLGQARIRGVSFEADYQPAHELRLQASYLLSDARVTEFPAAPEIEGNLLPQVPRHRASLRLDYLNPEGAQREPARPLRELPLRRRPEPPPAGQPLRGGPHAGPPAGGLVGSLRLGREPLRSPLPRPGHPGRAARLALHGHRRPALRPAAALGLPEQAPARPIEVAAMASQHTVYFGLGSNLGDRQANLVEGIQRLRAQVDVLRLSSVYETEPAYVTDQPRFLNMVAKGVTALDPHALLAFLKRIEQGMGRRDEVRYGPRPIDIDILFYDDQVIRSESLTVPHPLLAERGFVLVPLQRDRARPPASGPGADGRRAPGRPREDGRCRPGRARADQPPGARPAARAARARRCAWTGSGSAGCAASSASPTGTGSSTRPSTSPWSCPRSRRARTCRASATPWRRRWTRSGRRRSRSSSRWPSASRGSSALGHGARRVDVEIRAHFPLTRRAPLSGKPSQELYTLIGRAVATPDRCVRLVGVEAEGMMACPCAQDMVRTHARERLVEDGIDGALADRVLELVPIATHNQRGLGRLMVGTDRPLRAEDLVEIVETSMSSENYDLLKRPDELFVVEKAHRHPRFVEDAVREMLLQRHRDVPGPARRRLRARRDR